MQLNSWAFISCPAVKAPERLLRNEEVSSALTDLVNGVKMSCERTNTQALLNIELNQSRRGQVLDTHRSVLKVGDCNLRGTSRPLRNQSQANLLGASFFFVQDVQGIGDMRLIITTIACHLARVDRPVGPATGREQLPKLKSLRACFREAIAPIEAMGSSTLREYLCGT
ncbi:hypothetical protein AB1N83_006668 [Pleurotus pulmonarius]